MKKKNEKMEEQYIEKDNKEKVTDKIVNTDNKKIINTKEKPIHNWGTQER